MTIHATLSFTLPATVVVTGASSGLGHALCQLLVEAGVATIGVDRATSQPDLQDRPGYRHFAMDVTKAEKWAEVAAPLRQAAPASLGLVTSAAILEVGSILESDRDGIIRMLDVNVVGTALAIQAVLPLMVEQGGGAIVAVASVDATFAEQQLAVYAASKAAVRQLARTIALDHPR